jgi:hypothetical protein
MAENTINVSYVKDMNEGRFDNEIETRADNWNKKLKGLGYDDEEVNDFTDKIADGTYTHDQVKFVVQQLDTNEDGKVDKYGGAADGSLKEAMDTVPIWQQMVDGGMALAGAGAAPAPAPAAVNMNPRYEHEPLED